MLRTRALMLTALTLLLTRALMRGTLVLLPTLVLLASLVRTARAAALLLLALHLLLLRLRRGVVLRPGFAKMRATCAVQACDMRWG